MPNQHVPALRILVAQLCRLSALSCGTASTRAAISSLVSQLDPESAPIPMAAR